MERELVGRSVNVRQTIDDLQAVANHVCKKWKVPPLSVWYYNKPNAKEFGYQTGWSIHLNEGFHGANINVLMHELAHHITSTYYPCAPDHGALFMDVYCDLLDEYKLMPRDCMLVLCARYDVEVGDN
jgi:hypothetical protein